MPDVYKHCPTVESPHFRIRPLSMDDCADLLKVYSDPAAVPFFTIPPKNGCGRQSISGSWNIVGEASYAGRLRTDIPAE